jgi:hypothetical protein
MATSTLKKTIIMEDQNIMALFTVLNSELVLKEAKEYFMLQKREEFGKLQTRPQPTIIILANVSPPKEIQDPTTPQGDMKMKIH